jgi:hypothetical protein
MIKDWHGIHEKTWSLFFFKQREINDLYPASTKTAQVEYPLSKMLGTRSVSDWRFVSIFGIFSCI